MKFKQIVATLFILLSSNSANAGLITYNGYTLDTDTNIVSDGNLEWLQWDETDGMSINTALSVFGAEGWLLASEDNVSDLMNDFFGNITVWDNNPESNQFAWYPYQSGEDIGTDVALQFQSLFGSTWGNPDHTLDFAAQANAYFNYDNRSTVSVYLDSTDSNGNSSDGQLRLFDADHVSLATSSNSFGVALVRAVPPSTDVPEPSTLAMFSIAMLVLLRLKNYRL